MSHRSGKAICTEHKLIRCPELVLGTPIGQLGRAELARGEVCGRTALSYLNQNVVVISGSAETLCTQGILVDPSVTK